MFGAQQGRPAAAAGRRTLRERKVSQRMAVVDESTRQQAVQARLDALEADNEVGDDTFALNSDDDDFIIAQDDDEEEEEVEISGKRKRPKKAAGGGPPPKRKLRTGVTGGGNKLPRSFARLLEDAQLDRLPAGTPSYLTAQVAPAKACAPRKFCSVCGNNSSYTCARCGSRYCCRRCHNTHVETRCLKFIS